MKLSLNMQDIEINPKKSVKDVPGFYKYNRFIVLSEVTSDTIPNILDLIFDLTSGRDNTFTSNKTKVTVINNSEVYGSIIYGYKNTRTRSVYIHHGEADCNVDCIRGDTIIRFTDVDFNVLADKPWEIEARGEKLEELPQVQMSYDNGITGGIILRDQDKYRKIMVPSPEFYDETDMVYIGNKEEDYNEVILENKENKYYSDQENYQNNLYTLTLNDLIDEHTKVMKLNIKIDNLTSRKYVQTEFDIQRFNEQIHEVICETKYALERNGFSSAKIILNGNHGFNVTDLKTYLNLGKLEKIINYQILCGDVERINDSYYDKGCENDYSILIHVNHCNVNVVIVDFVNPVNAIPGSINRTDSDTKELGISLKNINNENCFSTSWY